MQKMNFHVGPDFQNEKKDFRFGQDLWHETNEKKLSSSLGSSITLEVTRRWLNFHKGKLSLGTNKNSRNHLPNNVSQRFAKQPRLRNFDWAAIQHELKSQERKGHL